MNHHHRHRDCHRHRHRQRHRHRPRRGLRHETTGMIISLRETVACSSSYGPKSSHIDVEWNTHSRLYRKRWAPSLTRTQRCTQYMSCTAGTPTRNTIAKFDARNPPPIVTASPLTSPTMVMFRRMRMVLMMMMVLTTKLKIMIMSILRLMDNIHGD